MIPKVNNRGHSFKGVTAYLMHDKEAQTAERVAWFETGNLYTNDPNKAAKVMAWTDLNADYLKQQAGISQAGRKTETGSTYHYSLSWAKSDNPTQDHQRESVLASLEKLGLSDHQYYMVSHNDTDHAHVHVVANLTHPETGKRAELGLDKRGLQDWALEYEREHGIHCQQREKNALKREQGIATKHQDKKQDYARKVTRAFELSDNGQSFRAALQAEGLHLAPARRGKGFVLIDEKGDIQKLTRQLDPADKYGVAITGKEKGALIQARLKDIDRAALPDPDQLAKQLRQGAPQPQPTPEKKLPDPERTKPHVTGQTKQLADEYIKLAQNPLSDLRGWMDETGQQGQDLRGVSARSSRDHTQHNELLPIRGKGERRKLELEPYDREAALVKQQNDMLDGTEKAAKEQAREIPTPDFIEKEYPKPQKDWSSYEQKIERKIATSKAKWQIEELETAHAKAQAEANKPRRFWERLFQRQKITAANDHAQDMKQRLDERRSRWLADIDAYNSKRPQWAQDEARVKYGFEKQQQDNTAAPQTSLKDRYQSLQDKQTEQKAEMRQHAGERLSERYKRVQAERQQQRDIGQGQGEQGQEQDLER
jgi:hypothetical protein